MHSDNILIQAVNKLAAVLQGAEPDEQQRQTLEDLVSENELLENEAVPAWLIELLTYIQAQKPTGTWMKFTLSGLDDSNVLNFIQELDQILPMQFENQEENWLLTFPAIGIEAALSFEGYCYKVSKIGSTWE
jgi:hypothetical protein